VVLPCVLKSTLLTTGHTVSFHNVDNSHTPWHSLGNACKTDNIVVVPYTRKLAYFFFQVVDLSKRIISYSDSVDCRSGLPVIKRLLYVKCYHMHRMDLHYSELHVPI